MATLGERRIETGQARTAEARRPAVAHPFRLLYGAGALAALGAASCSGFGEVEIETAPTAVTFASNSFPGSEALNTGTLVVALVTEVPETTGEIMVTVSDLGTGTATSGADYAAFDPFVVTFPAGSVNGDTVNIDLSVLSDNTAEGADETVRFGLSDPSGAAIVGVAQTDFVINDAQLASLAFDTTSTLTPDESSSSYTVDVTLGLTPGATLGFDIDTTLQDDGTGTADSGVDYVAVASTPVQFPAGTAAGAQQTITLQVLDDADAEGLEFFAIHIIGGSLNELDRSGTTRHVVNITDDESAPTALMTATSGATGMETTHAGGGDVMDMGIGINDAGPTTGSVLIVSNTGTQSMNLNQPTLSGTNESDFKLEVESASLETGMRGAAGLTPPSDFIDLGAPFQRAVVSAANTTGSGLKQVARPGLSVTLDEAALLDLSLVDRVRFHGFPLPNGLGEVTLEMERIALPIASDAILSVNGVTIPGGPRTLLTDLSTWSGTIVEMPGSKAFIAFNGNVGPRGFIKLAEEGDNMIHIASESHATATSPATSRMVHESDLADLVSTERPSCAGQIAVPGTTRDNDLVSMGFLSPSDLPLGAGGMPSIGSTPGTSETTVANCRLAIETDFQLYEKFNSESDLTDYVTSLIAAISDQYFEDVQTTFSIAYLGIHSDSNDGWTTPDGPGDTAAMLAEFKAAWSDGANTFPASADLAHFLSGANLGGGRAYLGVICNQTYGFGVSGNLRANINWATWTGNASAIGWDFIVVAHEIGHNFGAEHTHELCPPLDSCYASPCVGTTSCSQGTIMSYCHTCSGGTNNIDLNFHPVVSDIMRAEVNASCLGDALMESGDEIRYRLRFDPRSGAGAKTATLRFEHSAPNAPSPFNITLNATAN